MIIEFFIQRSLIFFQVRVIIQWTFRYDFRYLNGMDITGQSKSISSFVGGSKLKMDSDGP